MGFTHEFSVCAFDHPTDNYAEMHNYRERVQHSTCYGSFETITTIFMCVLYTHFTLILPYPGVAICHTQPVPCEYNFKLIVPFFFICLRHLFRFL